MTSFASPARRSFARSFSEQAHNNVKIQENDLVAPSPAPCPHLSSQDLIVHSLREEPAVCSLNLKSINAPTKSLPLALSRSCSPDQIVLHSKREIDSRVPFIR